MPILTKRIQESLRAYFLRDYLQIIFRRRKFFLLPFIIVFFTATIGSFFLPRYYQSSVIILVEEEKVVNPLVKESRYAMGRAPTLTEQMKTLHSKILSLSHLTTLVKKLELDKNITSPIAYQNLIQGIRKRTHLKMLSPDIFRISYEDKNPGMSQRLVNTLIQVFIEDTIATKKKRALVGVKFAEGQAKLYKKRLEKSEKALYEFKKKYPLQLPGEEEKLNISLLINYQTSLTSVEMSLNEAKKELNLIRKQILGQEPFIISGNMVSLNPIVQRLNNKLQDLQSILDMLLTDDPESPKILNVQLEIEDTREKLRLETEKLVNKETAATAPLFYQSLEQKLKDAQENVNNLKVRKENFKRLVKKYETMIGSLPEQKREYINLMRDAKVNSNIYEMLLVKAEENRLTAEEMKEKGTRYSLLDKARLPLRPSRPQKLLIGIVAFIIGILSGSGCVFLAEFSDQSFHGFEDAKKILKFPIISCIDKIESKEELATQKVRRKQMAIFLIILFSLLLISMVIGSFVQERRITQEIIKAETLEESSE